jgi:multicomponent Na+:H+ antiporter subunit D
MYVFYELLSLSTYPLVTHAQNKEARSGGRTYLSHLMITSIGLALPAVFIVYWLTGGTADFSTSTGIVTVEHFADKGMAPGTFGVMLILFLLYGFAKCGIMPVHSWLPAAMVAPTPVSALLHAVAVVKVGAFCIFRVLTEVFSPELLMAGGLHEIVMALACFTIIVGSLIALSQDNLKRRLAFSTIAQLSYIILGATLIGVTGTGQITRDGQIGGLVHIAMHAFSKITLFFCAGAIYIATNKKYISEMKGLGRVMPLTFLAFLIGSLGVIGLPPGGGFASKWVMVQGAIDAGYTPVLWVMVVSSILNCFYFFPIVYHGFFGKADGGDVPPDSPTQIKEAPMWCVVPLCITAVSSIVLFFASGYLFELGQHLLTGTK